MTKEQFLEILVKELERLENVEHVSDLANNGRCAEVDAVVAEIEYSALEEYMDEVDDKGDLSVKTDIPEPYVLTFVIYLSGSEYDEVEVMKDWGELQEALYGCGDVGNVIANKLEYNYINAFGTFEELVFIEAVDENEDEGKEDSDEDGDAEETDEDYEESEE